MENRQYFTEFVILDMGSEQNVSRVGNYFFEIEADEKDVTINDIVNNARSVIVLESKRKGFLVSKEQIHFRQFNRV